MNWEIAEIIDLDDTQIKFKIINNKNEQLEDKFKKNIKWTIPNKKSISDRHNIGDIIFVKRKKCLETKTISKS